MGRGIHQGAEGAAAQGARGFVRGEACPFTGCPPLVLQSAVEALEQEKLGLQGQIAQVLEGRQQLAQLKMSLSLEVATYRYGFPGPARRTDAHTPSEARSPPAGPRAMGGGNWAAARSCDSRPASYPTRACPTRAHLLRCVLRNEKVSWA